MAQLKGRHTYVQRFSGTTRDLSKRKAVTAEDDRQRLIAESLREIRGIEVIYAIRCPDGLIKIGHTADLQSRRRHFDSDPNAILAVRQGTYDEEQAIHATLNASCARGREYYHPTPEVLAFVNGIRQGYGLDPLPA